MKRSEPPPDQKRQGEHYEQDKQMSVTTSASTDTRYEIRLAGSGGQGIILASVILARAVIHDPTCTLHVCQTQSYGPEARGGTCKAEVVISDAPIDYPKVIKLDLLLAMNQESCDSYFYDFKPDGILVIDSTFVEQVPTSRVIALPFTQIAREQVGKDFVANMVALGALSGICRHINPKHLEETVAEMAPEGTKTLNRKAFKAGQKAFKEINLSLLPRSITPTDPEEMEL